MRRTATASADGENGSAIAAPVATATAAMGRPSASARRTSPASGWAESSAARRAIAHASTVRAGRMVREAVVLMSTMIGQSTLKFDSTFLGKPVSSAT
ncbi:MAG: hypothetical protein QOE86_4127 [Solirubrobacteraceae bacterium]|nr:hypothetical protein [Solirubrobacteraceae bacterium]